MPGYCSAINCSSGSKVDTGIHFFRFPKDKDRCKLWVRNCRRADLVGKDPIYLNTNCRLCERHFDDSQFMNSDCKSRLNWKAVPKIFEFTDTPPKSDCLKRKLPLDSTVMIKQQREDAADDDGSEDNLETDISHAEPFVSNISECVSVSRNLLMKNGMSGFVSSNNTFSPPPPSIQTVIHLARQLGMRNPMAEFFEEQLRKCALDRDRSEGEMSSSKEGSDAGAAGKSSPTDVPKAKVLVQQCLSAKLLVRPATEASPDLFVQISRGIVVFVCFLQGATTDVVQKLAKTVLNVRLSETDAGKLVSVLDLPGDVLIVPQATLGGRLRGTAMQYHKNVDKAVGEQLYNEFVRTCQTIVERNGASVEHGCGVLKGTYGNRQVLTMETNGPYSHIIEL